MNTIRRAAWAGAAIVALSSAAMAAARLDIVPTGLPIGNQAVLDAAFVASQIGLLGICSYAIACLTRAARLLPAKKAERSATGRGRRRPPGE